VVITDHRGLTEWVNHAFTEKTGYTLEDMRGRTPGSVLQGRDTNPETVRKIRESLHAGRSIDTELLNYTHDHQPYWVQCSITPVRDADGNVERFVAIQSDSTEWRRTQAELEAARSRAEAANIAKTLFLATISHEMRTPLNAILGSTDLALAGEDDPQVLRAHLTRISTSAEALLHLISDVLDVSKIEAGQIEIERVPVRLEAVVREAVSLIGDKAHRKGLTFEVVWDPALPVAIETDPARLRQIVSNLAENAVKFTDAGFVRIQAAAHPGAGPSDGPWMELSVRDSGSGISQGDQATVFERFVQADSSTTRRNGGAGLGLSIVRSLVEALGGEVTVTSHEGVGTEFSVRLPIAPVADPLAPGEPPSWHLTGSGVALRRRGTARILVAEDNDINFQVVEAYLQRDGYEVRRARNGMEAVAAAFDVDLVLMDLEMPDMDGVAATRAIRQAEAAQGIPATPVLALTAHALQEYRDQALEAGCDGYIAKPVRMQALLDAVAGALV